MIFIIIIMYQSVFEKYFSNTPKYANQIQIQIQIFHLVGFQIQIQIQIQIFVYLNTNTNTNTYLTPALFETPSWSLWCQCNWGVMMPTMPLLATPVLVITTTSGATSDDQVGVLATLAFRVRAIKPSLGRETHGEHISWKLYWPFVRGIVGHRWILITKGQ